MAKLGHDQALALARIHIRSQNLLKGRALDLARASLSNEQYEAFKKLVKDYESGLRRGFMAALSDAGLIDEQISVQELAGLK